MAGATTRWRGCGAALALALVCAGCGRGGGKASTPFGDRTLTPTEYQILKDREKIAYKSVVIRVPESWGGALLPLSPGPYPSPTDKAIHGGDLPTLMGLYNQALFELQHPRVKVEYINFDMWSPNFRAALAVAISGGRAPSYYIARDLPQTIEQGMYADITPLMKEWDQYAAQPESSRREGNVDGRIYTMAANELGASVIRYRKDWFREAGIFNERGEPGPRSDWTWDDFREIARKLTDPSKGRYGFAGELGDFEYNAAHGLPLYVPDPTGRTTWRFNRSDPELLRSLQAARDMVNRDRSVATSVTMGWFEWHNEFDAGHAAMIPSFSPHIPRASLESPDKFGKDKPYAQTVGMAPPPGHPSGYSGLQAITNPIGFDPTLTPEQLRAAFDWCRSWFYGDIFLNRMRASIQEARIKGKRSTLYAELLALPYRPQEDLLDIPLEKVFPPDYLETYRRIRASHARPLPREFGLREPALNEMNKAVKALYSDAITRPNEDLKALVARHGDLIDRTILNHRGADDPARLRRYVAALDDFYRRWFPKYHREVWTPRRDAFYRIPSR